MSHLTIPVTSEDHSQGNLDARCTLVEYGDFQCSYCGQAYPIVKQLQKHFGNDLRFVFRRFSLSEIHPDAEHASEAAEFASEGGKFWEMHDLLYQNQEDLSDDALVSLVGQLHFPREELREALQAGIFRPYVQASLHGIRL